MVEELVGFAQWWIIPIVIGAVVIAQILIKRPKIQEKYSKKIDNIRNEYIDELEDKVKHYKNKASNMEKGPIVEGEIGELDAILPELVSGFESYAPKWLKPFLKNQETQKWIIKYATENPDKVSGWFGKLVKSKMGPEKQEQTSDAV